MKSCFFCLAFFLMEYANPSLADSDSVVYATVRNAVVPLYPPLARAARVQGTVIMEVTTAGEAFGAIKVISGHPLLSNAAIANLMTWTLDGSSTTIFRITYHYSIGENCKGNPTVTLNLPTEVSICSPPSPPMY